MPSREQLIDARETVANGILGHTLQMQIERGVHVDRLGCRRRQPGIVIGERLPDEIDEVGSFRFQRPLNDSQRFLGGAVGSLALDVPGVDHRLKHDVAPIFAAAGVAER